MGRGGRKILKKVLSHLRAHIEFDFITINGENLAGGFGITEKIFFEIKEMGVDALTMGNHWKDKADIHRLRKEHRCIVLPQNILSLDGVEQVPTFELKSKPHALHIINLMGNFAMKDEYGSPFDFLHREKPQFADKVKSGAHIVIADIHAEASSEKQAIAWLYDGILAGLIGTHTHTPTSDERITDKGTAFLTDVGMTGSYDSVIGMQKERVIQKLSFPKVRCPHEVALEDLWFCAFLLEVNPSTGLTQVCYRLQCRGVNDETWLISRVEA